MAFSTTYAQLIADAQAYVDDDLDEFEAQLPGMIQRAQDAIQIDLDLEMHSPIKTATTTANVATLARDASWLKVKSIMFTASGRFAERRSVDWVRMYNATAAAGIPKYYAEHDDGLLLLAPKPSAALACELVVMERLPALSVSNTSNWISENVGDALFWMVLVEAEAFLISAERVQEFATKYGDAITRAKRALRGADATDYDPVRRAAATQGA
jgi:hypothetical protein